MENKFESVMRSLNEDAINYEVKQLVIDVAVKAGDKIRGIDGSSPDGSLYRDIANVLRKHGYQMAGDYIDVTNDVTDVYVDNDYEFFD